MLIFEERGKPENPEKNLLEQSKEPTTNLTHSWPKPGHVCWRRVQSPLRQLCSREKTNCPVNGQKGKISKKINIVLQDCACLSVIQYISRKIRLLYQLLLISNILLKLECVKFSKSIPTYPTEQVCEVRSNIFNER